MLDLNVMFPNAKPLADNTWVGPGNHSLILISYNVTQTEIKAELLIEASDYHQPGTSVNVAWQPHKPGWKGEQDIARAVSFVMALFGYDDQAHSGPAGAQLATPEQPGCGMRIRAVGIPTARKLDGNGQEIIPLDDAGKPKKPWINVTWYHVEDQTGPSVLEGRAKCVAFQQGLAAPTAAPQAVAAPAPTPVAVAPAPVQVAPQAVAPTPVQVAPTQVAPAPEQVAPVTTVGPPPGSPFPQ